MTFEKFSVHLSKIEATTKRNEMTALLSALLKEASADEVDKVVYLSLGQLAPLYALKEFSMADKMVIRAISRAYGEEELVVRREFKNIGDLGTVAEEIARKKEKGKRKKERESIQQIFDMLVDITQESGKDSQERKLAKTATLLQSLNPLGAKYAIRIILDKLRLGFSDKTVLDALSVMIKGDKSAREQLEAAYNVRPDVGWLASQVQRSKFSARGRSTYGGKVQNLTADPKMGVPVLPALCQRLPSTEEIIEKMGEVAVEPKWDGQRIQAHVQEIKAKGQGLRENKKNIMVKLFTRSLEDVTDMFPDLDDSLKRLMAFPLSLSPHPLSLILDGEVVAFDPASGKVLPFQTMITRKRKYGVAEQLKSVPVRYMVFDLLFLNGESLLEKPFSERREFLEKLLPNNQQRTTDNLIIAPQVTTNSPIVIRKYLKEQTDKGLEGIVTKQWNAPYSPGRTGFTWVKMKWEGEAKSGGLLDTIDCVIMGTYAGRGKRSGFGVGAFLVGILHGETFLTISKIGTGLSDEQWRELKAHSSQLTAHSQPKEYNVPKALVPDTWIEPEIIVEIQADNITNSPLHSAGFALRFPRLVRYRTDKKPNQITTLEEVKKLHKIQGG